MRSSRSLIISIFIGLLFFSPKGLTEDIQNIRPTLSLHETVSTKISAQPRDVLLVYDMIERKDSEIKKLKISDSIKILKASGVKVIILSDVATTLSEPKKQSNDPAKRPIFEYRDKLQKMGIDCKDSFAQEKVRPGVITFFALRGTGLPKCNELLKKNGYFPMYYFGILSTNQDRSSLYTGQCLVAFLYGIINNKVADLHRQYYTPQQIILVSKQKKDDGIIANVIKEFNSTIEFTVIQQ